LSEFCGRHDVKSIVIYRKFFPTDRNNTTDEKFLYLLSNPVRDEMFIDMDFSYLVKLH